MTLVEHIRGLKGRVFLVYDLNVEAWADELAGEVGYEGMEAGGAAGARDAGDARDAGTAGGAAGAGTAGGAGGAGDADPAGKAGDAGTAGGAADAGEAGDTRDADPAGKAGDAGTAGGAAGAGLAGRGGFAGRMGIEASEDNKQMDTVLDICRFLLAMGADRDATLVAMGGGVTTDMCAFAASIYKRGIHCILVPTTLLSMVDAAHGGKTGVNLDGLKNMIGTFAPPSYETFTDVRYLLTLPRRELLSGAAELLKTFIIEDNGHYERAVALFSALNRESRESGAGHNENEGGAGHNENEGDAGHNENEGGAGQNEKDAGHNENEKDAGQNENEGGAGQNGDTGRLSEAALTELKSLIDAAVAVKTGIVERDRLESGERRKLNLGHTVGHAIEWYEHVHGRRGEGNGADSRPGPLSHGEAVAIGIVQAARISAARCICDPALPDKIAADLEACGLPTRLPYPMDELQEAISKDKKNSGGSPRYVLIRAIGDVLI